MPDRNDWISLKNTINSHKIDVVETWGSITMDNVEILCMQKCRGKTLFEFLLANNHFYDANTIASIAVYFDEKTVQLIYEKHHDKYNEILRLLCTDKMILLYEQYHKKINDFDPSDNEFNEIYRTVISNRFEKLIMNENNDNIIIDLINEFKFLSHPYLEDFYIFCSEIDTMDPINKFTELYGKYTEIMPLIYRLINEYYLEYIKYQLNTINDMFGNSYILVSELYDNFKKSIISLPKNYVDFRYTDRNGDSIISCLINLPLFSKQVNIDIYEAFFDQIDYYPLEIINGKGNNIFHMIAADENEIFLDTLINWIFVKSEYAQEKMLQSEYLTCVKNDLTNIFQIENSDGKTIFDVLFEKNNYAILIKLIEYMPPRAYLKLTNRLIENFDIVDEIPNNEIMDKIYIDSIHYFINELFKMKQEIIFDMSEYSDYKMRVNKLLSKCTNKINTDYDYQLEWMMICIKNNELEIFKNILSKYFFNEQNNSSIKYLSKVVVSTSEPIIITAIKEQKIPFIKCLLKYNIDLSIVDKFNSNALIVALETKNIFLLRLIHDHIVNTSTYLNMNLVIENYINLLETHETYNNFSFIDTIKKIFNTVEYLINYLVDTFGECDKK